jgi:hypothetical protein
MQLLTKPIEIFGYIILYILLAISLIISIPFFILNELISGER